MAMFCKTCGGELKDGTVYCPNCGAPVEGEKKPETISNTSAPTASGDTRSRLAAGLLGIFLGGWGVHNFYLGYNSKGAIQIVVTLLTCGIGALWGFIEGILILAGSINVDADGKPLGE